VYEVETQELAASPMVLIAQLDALGPHFPLITECAEEYWAPTMGWRFLEFICGEIRVTTCLGALAEACLWKSGEDYEYDRDLARRRWG